MTSLSFTYILNIQLSWYFEDGFRDKYAFNYGVYNFFKVIATSNGDASTQQVMTISNDLGLESQWDEDDGSSTYQTNAYHHGFDQGTAISGLLRSKSASDSEVVGNAAKPGSRSWGVPGFEKITTILFLSDEGFIVTIAHEMAHNFGAEHDGSWCNVMYENYWHQCLEWESTTLDQINIRKSQFSQPN